MITNFSYLLLLILILLLLILWRGRSGNCYNIINVRQIDDGEAYGDKIIKNGGGRGSGDVAVLMLLLVLIVVMVERYC